MANIFISYAREDERWAANLTQALTSYGWSTWWDPEIPPGKQFDEIIEKELSSAKCIIVGWSIYSVKSRWVKAEAQEAIEQDKYIPVLIEDIKVPLGFRILQNIDLTAWDGTVNSSKLERLVLELEKKLGPALNPNVPQEEYKRNQEFFIKLLEHDTGQISTIVRIIRQNKAIIGMDLFRANHRAHRFFNWPETKSLSGVSGAELIDRLRYWVNENDIETFVEDQNRLAQNLTLGRECLAKVPIRINDQHPYTEFRGQSFMPVIVSFSGKFSIDEHVEELVAVTYFNLSTLCTNI